MPHSRPRPAANSRFLHLFFAALGAALLLRSGPVAARPATPSGPGQTFSTPGTTIWYEVRGAGPGVPLILVNGGPGFDHTYELCSDVWDRLATHRRVVLWDQRGNGRSGPLKPGQSCTLKDQIADLAKYDLWPLLPGFTMPTLVLTGRFDINVAPSTAWKIHRAIPKSRFVVFEMSGHMPFFEEPEAFLAAVEPFLGAP